MGAGIGDRLEVFEAGRRRTPARAVQEDPGDGSYEFVGRVGPLPTEKESVSVAMSRRSASGSSNITGPLRCGHCDQPVTPHSVALAAGPGSAPDAALPRSRAGT